jgi:hypothetical protein
MDAKHLSGTLWYTWFSSGLNKPPTDSYFFRVDECILKEKGSEKELSLDYVDEGATFHIRAKSTDNFIFKGEYDAKTIQGDKGDVDLRHYQNGFSHLFYGNWSSGNQEGKYIIELVEKE